MNCEQCQSNMNLVTNQQHYHCVSCNRFEFPTSIELSADKVVPAGKATDFLCPKCDGHNLQIGTISGTQVCFCDNCRGFVIDRLSLGELIEALRGAYEGKDDPPIAICPNAIHEVSNCPACFEKMETFNYCGPGNVVIDSCNGCQLTWLNHGELAQIVRAPGKREYDSSLGFIAVPRPSGTDVRGTRVDLAMWLADELF